MCSSATKFAKLLLLALKLSRCSQLKTDPYCLASSSDQLRGCLADLTDMAPGERAQYSCLVADCAEAFEHESERLVHHLTAHPDVYSYSCDVAGCYYASKSKAGLNQHKRQAHTSTHLMM
jgi:hypothetical protein